MITSKKKNNNLINGVTDGKCRRDQQKPIAECGKRKQITRWNARESRGRQNGDWVPFAPDWRRRQRLGCDWLEHAVRVITLDKRVVVLESSFFVFNCFRSFPVMWLFLPRFFYEIPNCVLLFSCSLSALECPYFRM